MPRRRFAEVDVFGRTPYAGNPVAVVLDCDGLDAAAMQQFTRWTNLSEAAFVLPPTHPDADYAVRIFMGSGELPFAGHPTLGACHAWLHRSGAPAEPESERRAGPAQRGDRAPLIVQQCGAGLIPIRREGTRLAFEAPPLRRFGQVEEEVLARVAGQLRIAREEIVDSSWADNGPGWVAVLLADADAVQALCPGEVELMIGVAGLHPAGSPEALEVRAFCPGDGAFLEDPVTGSLNASLAQWLLGSGRLSAPYVAAQGRALGRDGRVEVSVEDDRVFVGGATVTCLEGTVEL